MNASACFFFDFAIKSRADEMMLLISDLPHYVHWEEKYDDDDDHPGVWEWWSESCDVDTDLLSQGRGSASLYQQIAIILIIVSQHYTALCNLQ